MLWKCFIGFLKTKLISIHFVILFPKVYVSFCIGYVGYTASELTLNAFSFVLF